MVEKTSKKQIRKKYTYKLVRYISIALIFLYLGLMLGYYSNPLSTEKVALLLKTTSSQMDLLNLQFDYLQSMQNCTIDSLLLSNISTEIGGIGRVLSQYDQKGIKNDFYYFLKTKYSLFEIRLYMYYKSYMKTCNTNDNIVLYFWSLNNASEQQGKILDSLVESHNLKVLSVEYNYSESYQFIENIYNINSGPALIINYNKTFIGLTNSSEIIKSLKKNE